MKTLPFVFLVFTIGCGEELLPEGDYDVSVYYVKDNWPVGLEGTEARSVWEVKDRNNKKHVTVVSGMFNMMANKEGRVFTFGRSMEGDCGDSISFHATVRVDNDDPEKFTGNTEERFEFCDGGVLLQEAHVVGEKQ